MSREHPDSLSDRAWERLQQLEAACERERARAAGGSDVSVGRSGHHWGGWIWMPTMMVVGTLTWVLMGGGL